MPGVNTGFIDVDIVDDNLFESSLETFSVELVANDTRLATISPTEGSFEVSIRDNETLIASISADAERVAEGNDTTFTVTLTGGIPAGDVSVPFETAGSATVTGRLFRAQRGDHIPARRQQRQGRSPGNSRWRVERDHHLPDTGRRHKRR